LIATEGIVYNDTVLLSVLISSIIHSAQNLLGIRQEVLADASVIGGAQNKLNGSSLADLDLVSENVVVIVAQVQSGNSLLNALGKYRGIHVLKKGREALFLFVP
jgi:hypothetical protein